VGINTLLGSELQAKIPIRRLAKRTFFMAPGTLTESDERLHAGVSGSDWPKAITHASGQIRPVDRLESHLPYRYFAIQRT